MNGITFALLASGCASFANYFFRRSSSSNMSSGPNFYLFIYFLSSFLISLVIYAELRLHSPSWLMIGIGALLGMLSIGLMLATSQALSRGPAGLTFAFQNASAIFPGILLFLIFGASYGFSCSLCQVIGLLFVLFGLYWGCRGERQGNASFAWLKYALACFIIQIAALSLMQARCLLFECDFIPVQAEDDIWFMPAQFATATVLQGFICLYEKAKAQKQVIFYGTMAGIANGAATCLLLLATKIALPIEKTILFPSFSVATIILCNVWASKLYGEKFNTITNATCAAGIVISALG
ncbi:Uncharacterized protein PHSC3_000319 [Chlamydiales bacterium STE3]|nr:Uncharacterized protein PHSC3_000319 [Chlamydiales bacterium STE3]